MSARLTLLLMPILGLTWLFGVFAMNEGTLAFDYLFTIFNSFQVSALNYCVAAISLSVSAPFFARNVIPLAVAAALICFPSPLLCFLQDLVIETL